ncbi:acyltransferase family protein [Stutzerimonas tarimensis]|uniref:Acyltransferase family protein n=1 Tax=Stutzerimonas tarimensis TaxID=1507735 RepID=A0ABV7T6I0_9GAMM
MRPTGSFHSRENNFDFLRFFAASVVIVSHCYFMLGLEEMEPFLLTTGYEDGGAIAVGVFFVISGYLITGSYLNSSSRFSYFLKRALRLFPALFVAILLTVFLVGPLVTTLNLTEYVSETRTWMYLRNIMLMTSYDLPGVYLDNPYTGVVNGSLWTLPMEASMYVGVAALGMIGFLRRGLIFIPLAALAAGEFWLIAYLGISSFTVGKFFQLGLLFFIGAAFYLYRDLVLWKGWIALLLALAMVLSFRTPLGYPMYFVAMPYVVLYLAYAPIPWLSRFGKYGDFSYGIYIVHFPLMQAWVLMLGSGVSILQLLLLTYVPTLVLAALSWHYVEAPALKLKRLFAAAPDPGQAAPARGDSDDTGAGSEDHQDHPGVAVLVRK